MLLGMLYVIIIMIKGLARWVFCFDNFPQTRTWKLCIKHGMGIHLQDDSEKDHYLGGELVFFQIFRLLLRSDP